MGSDIVREQFRDLRFRTSERDLVRETEWFECYEADDPSVFKNFLFIGQRFVLPLLIVATKIYFFIF